MAEEITIDEFTGLPTVDLSDAKVEGGESEQTVALNTHSSFSIEAKMTKDTKRFCEHYAMLLRIKQTAQIRLRNRFDVKKRI